MRKRQNGSCAPLGQHNQQGLTLVELMISVAVAAILLGIAVPSFTEMRLSVRSNTSIDQLQQDFIYGRQLSVAYQNAVTICPLNSSNQCDGKWLNGYHIFIDGNNNKAFDSGEERLISRAAFNDDDFVTAANLYRFDTEGFLDAAGTLIYCPGKKSSDYNKQLDLTATGLISRNGTPGDCQ